MEELTFKEIRDYVDAKYKEHPIGSKECKIYWELKFILSQVRNLIDSTPKE